MFLLTLYNYLVAGHQDLLAITCLGILQNGGAWLGASRIGHRQCLEALNPICSIIGQLDGPTLCDGNWGRKNKTITWKNATATEVIVELFMAG